MSQTTTTNAAREGTMDEELKPLSKTEVAQYVETVAGTIIGDYAATARLYSKKTRNQVSSGSFANDQKAREWATAWSARMKLEMGAEFARVYGSDGFELRIWD